MGRATGGYSSAVGEQIIKEKLLVEALERIEVKAHAGLCYFTLESAREFLKDVRDEVADALGNERPDRS